jgi:CheY-like chemotaxis protein
MLAVLLVDNDTDVLEVTRQFLEQDGDMRVTTAQSGQEALVLLARERYDAIVADCFMQGMTGIDLLKTVRRAGPESGAGYGDPVFIIFTGKSREKIAIEAINSGTDYYIRKGHRTADVFATLKESILAGVRRRRQRAGGDTIHPVRDETRSPSGVGARLTGGDDIPATPGTEIKLQASRPPAVDADYPLLQRIAGSSEGIVIVSRDGAILFMNPAAAPLLGLASPEDGVGRKILDLIPEAAGDLALLSRISMGLISKFRLPDGASKREAVTRFSRVTFQQEDAVLLEIRV